MKDKEKTNTEKEKAKENEGATVIKEGFKNDFKDKKGGLDTAFD
jgi:hypothetical protein